MFYNALSTYGSNKSYNPVDNNGYFIQNNIATLDTTGEWYYDVSAKTIYIDFTGSTPDNNSIKVSTRDKNIVLDHVSNIILNGLDFEGGNIIGLHLFNCQNITVNNCKFLDEGGVSIYGAPTNNITVQNSSITNSLSNGIYFEFNGNDCTIDNVTVQNTNIIAGSGRSAILLEME